MKHGKNFTLGEYVIIKKPELVKVGNNVRIADFCRISSACVIGSDCEIAPGTYIAGGDGKYTFEMGDCSSLAAGVPKSRRFKATSGSENTPASAPIR